MKSFSLIILATACAMAQELGYPRPIEFRSFYNENLDTSEHIAMVVGDTAEAFRQGAENNFKAKYPDRPTLVQINIERLFVWGTWIMMPEQRLNDLGLLHPFLETYVPEIYDGICPVTDFPGYFVYEAGAHSKSKIPPGQEIVTIKVSDMTPFAPNTNDFNVHRKDIPDRFLKDVVICPYKKGDLDWLNASFASVIATDDTKNTITVRRWNDGGSWDAYKKGAYIAPNANQILLDGFQGEEARAHGLREVDYVAPFLINVTRFSPRDPRTGLNAAEWWAKHYIDVKQEHYPKVDGFVTDVSAGTLHPSNRISSRADVDNDGKPDFFHFDGVDYWGLGMYDVHSYLRTGVLGKFEGLGADLILVSDSNRNDESRFFDIMNGAEFEHSMVHQFWPNIYTSSLDRFLLWATRGRRPDRTYVHNKNPVDSYHGGDAKNLAFNMHDNYYRLDMATACMGSGYVGKTLARPTGHPGVELAEDLKNQARAIGTVETYTFDEYHKGIENEWNWLGQPLGPAQRYTGHLGNTLYAFTAGAYRPRLETSLPYKVSLMRRMDKTAVRVAVTKTEPWHDQTAFGVAFKFPAPELRDGTEYTASFYVSAESPYGTVDERYAAIPRNVHIALRVGTTMSVVQEVLAFPEPRECFITLTAPATGDGELLFGLAEELGEVTVSEVQLREGCGDVMFREFENGLVILNGSAISPVTVPITAPRYRRIKGTQDPEHNNGEHVGHRVTVGPRDGLFLVKEGVR